MSKRTSQYRGVGWDKRQDKWVARINYCGAMKYLGRFDKEEDARDAYIAFKEKMDKINRNKSEILDFSNKTQKSPIDLLKRIDLMVGEISACIIRHEQEALNYFMMGATQEGEHQGEIAREIRKLLVSCESIINEK